MSHLIIFIKNPELGKVKTRLASTVGDERALRIYRALMTHTRQIAEATEAKRWLFYSQWINEEDEWSRTLFQKALQHPGDLGERMTQAFKRAFADQSGPVLIIGSDCAQLTPAIVAEAFAALETHDFVVGPAEDGGYYLLGMRTFHPEVFQKVAWSTEAVLPTTLRIMEQHGWTYHQTVTLSDIDYEEDWEKHGWQLDEA